MPATAPTLSDAHFDRLRKIIYDRAGIHFPDTKKYVLESRLSRRLDELGFEDFNQYILFLTAGPYQQDEFQEMFNRITINETSFFRNEPQLSVFENRVLPGLIEARAAQKRLRIWSAACSSGEEPYTLAIQLHRSLGIRLADWRIEILGTDISAKALSAAKAGRYGEYALRSAPSLVRQRYFSQTQGGLEIDPTIKQMVRFELLNLKDATAARRFGTFDVIFCRNVMIYFDQTMRQHCGQVFHRQLADDGVLFIGHSETLEGLGLPFERIPAAQAFAYTKCAESGKGARRVA